MGATIEGFSKDNGIADSALLGKNSYSQYSSVTIFLNFLWYGLIDWSIFFMLVYNLFKFLESFYQSSLFKTLMCVSIFVDIIFFPAGLWTCPLF
jgi:hypothetical protein